MDNDKIRVCDGQGNYVFVSYAHKDTERVIPVIRKLTEAGCRIWYDGGIGVGSEWAKEVSSYIEACTVFISFMSQNYLNSDNCIDEIYHAKSNKKNISLIYLEDASLPSDLQMRVRRYHYERIYKYKREEDFYNNLLKADGIRKCISEEETIGGKSNLTTKESLEETVSFRPLKIGAQKRIEKDGMVYIGETRFGKMHGYGIATYANGGIYEGYWSKNTWCGRGVMKYVGGDVMDAVWIDESHVQKGILKYANGDICEMTNVKDNVYTVSVKYGNGGRYEGEYIWERRTDYNGERFRGPYHIYTFDIAIIGYRYGTGVLKMNGNVYEGWWNHESIRDATIKYGDGTEFQGEVSLLEPFNGTMKYTNGDVYIGKFASIHGKAKGTMTYADGSVCEGDWSREELLPLSERPCYQKVLIGGDKKNDVIKKDASSDRIPKEGRIGDDKKNDVREISIVNNRNMSVDQLIRNVMKEMEQKETEKIVNLIEDIARSNSRILPNDPCPCGSGLKYKNCCGRK